MRWLFLIILSLNLAYLGWQTTQPVVSSYENLQPLKNVQAIVLLSELLLKESDQQMPDVTDEQATLLRDFDVSKQQQEPAYPQAKDEMQHLQKIEERKQPALTSDEKQWHKDVAITNQGTEQVVAEIEPLKMPYELPEELLQKERCFTLGYFRDLEKLRDLAREIKPYVVSVDFRDTEERELSLHWVYIQPKKNRKEAIATGKRLKAKKINDFYVIREGKNTHGVSLGYFRSKSSAYGLAEKAKNLGFDVTVEPIYRDYTGHWLDYQLASGADIPELVLDKYLQSTEVDKISHLSRECGD